MQFGKDVKTSRVSNAVAAGITTVNGTAVDMANFTRVVFVIAFGAIVAGAATAVKAQAGAVSDGSDAADLAGTNITVVDTDDNTLVILEVIAPLAAHRYVRPVVSRATSNVTIDSIVAHRMGARKTPITADATVSHYLGVLSPAYGTP